MTVPMDIPERIDGGRVVLRPLRRADRAMVSAWLNDPRVMAFWSGLDQPFGDDASHQWVEGFVGGGPDTRCLVIEAADGPIGFIELTRNLGEQNYAHIAEIDICIGAPAEWEKGYGSAALLAVLRWLFTQTGCERAFLQPRVRNERAVHVYENVGFRKEGILRKAELMDGEYEDSVMMAALRDEWIAQFGPGQS